MAEKKNFRLNCEICDARNMREDIFDGYDQIWINTEILLVSERSKRILERYPIQLNAETMVEAEEGVDLQIQNGVLELKADRQLEKDVVLCVNGTLTIAPGTEELLKRYLCIVVNGSVKYPESLGGCLSKMTVNGTATVYPDDCIQLKRNAVIDAYFALRAQTGSRYYAERRVILLDEKADAAALAGKQIRFVTQELLTTESKVGDVIPLISDDTELTVVPDGCSFVNGDTVLDMALLQRYGDKLYINGGLTLEESSTPLLSRISYLHVNGDVNLWAEQEEAFLALNAEYRGMRIRGGRVIANKLEVHVDAGMLAAEPKGICLCHCVSVVLDEELSAAQITELLAFENCAQVLCTKEQRPAVLMASRNVAEAVVKEEAKKEQGITGMINVETYVL